MFLGLLSFYDRFLDRRAMFARDPHQLLRKDVTWTWEKTHQQAFQSLKEFLLQRTVLAHYKPAKYGVVSCDAYPYGAGAVLAQKGS